MPLLAKSKELVYELCRLPEIHTQEGWSMAFLDFPGRRDAFPYNLSFEEKVSGSVSRIMVHMHILRDTYAAVAADQVGGMNLYDWRQA